MEISRVMVAAAITMAKAATNLMKIRFLSSAPRSGIPRPARFLGSADSPDLARFSPECAARKRLQIAESHRRYRARPNREADRGRKPGRGGGRSNRADETQ